MISEEQYKQAIKANDEAEAIINEYGRQKHNDFEARWKRFETKCEYFTDADLVYSAFTRCKKCSAGVAYPKECGGFHQWTCSNVLKGVGTANGHEAFPFQFYEIKSENQPSANGATTRPK